MVTMIVVKVLDDVTNPWVALIQKSIDQIN